MPDLKGKTKAEILAIIEEAQSALQEREREEDLKIERQEAAEAMKHIAAIRASLAWLQERGTKYLPRQWAEMDARKLPRITPTMKELAAEAEQPKGKKGVDKAG